jgi:hypothetical protein
MMIIGEDYHPSFQQIALLDRGAVGSETPPTNRSLRRTELQ